MGKKIHGEYSIEIFGDYCIEIDRSAFGGVGRAREGAFWGVIPTALRLKKVLNVLQVRLRAFSFTRLVSTRLSFAGAKNPSAQNTINNII